MADVVRLAIVYDTSQAAASVAALNTRLTALTTSATGAQVVFKKSAERWASSSDILAAMATDAARATKATGGVATGLAAVAPVATVSAARLRSVALAGTHLAAQLSAGNVSALGLAGSLCRLAGPTAAAGLILTVVNLVNAFQEFNKIVKDISLSIDKMQT